MNNLIAPSLMCVDLMNVEPCIRELEQAGVDLFHIDIMDNHFVPNITLCPDFVKQLKKITRVPLDVHLMIEEPEHFLHLYDCLDSSDYLVIHHETSVHIQRTLNAVKGMGVQTGLALNPATPLHALDYLTDDLDMVLLMTVNPGFAGQKLIPSTLEKIKKLAEYLKARGRADVLIEVDGNVSFENAMKMWDMGAHVYVGGSSSIFSAEGSIADNCAKLRKIINGKGDA